MPKLRKTPKGTILLRVTREGHRLAVIDGGQRAADWLKPDRTERWVIAQVDRDGEIEKWGQMASDAKARACVDLVVEGKLPEHLVWHETEEARQKTRAVGIILAASREATRYALAQAILSTISVEEIAMIVSGIARDPRDGDALRMRAIEFLASRIIGAPSSAPEEEGGKNADWRKQRDEFLESPLFQTLLEKAAQAGRKKAQKNPAPVTIEATVTRRGGEPGLSVQGREPA